MMRQLCVLVLCLVSIAHCVPQLSKDWSGQQYVVETYSDEHDKFEVVWNVIYYYSLTNNMIRTDASLNVSGPVVTTVEIRDFNKRKDYEIIAGLTCDSEDMGPDAELDNYWDWLVNATQTKPCTVGSVSGTEYSLTNKNQITSLCVSGTTPLLLTYNYNDANRNGKNMDQIYFKTYKPVNPDASVFTLPAICKI